MNVIDAYWTVRILREWEKGRRLISQKKVGEREITALFAFEQCGLPSLRERDLGGILGLPASSAADTIRKLADLGLIERSKEESSDKRDKPYELTESGRRKLEDTRRIMCKRYAHLFENLAQDGHAASLIEQATRQIKSNAICHFQDEVFDGVDNFD